MLTKRLGDTSAAVGDEVKSQCMLQAYRTRHREESGTKILPGVEVRERSQVYAGEKWSNWCI